MSRPDAYHHGDLRRALFEALAETVLEVGPSAVGLRDLARRAGVSHAAPAYHFGDKRGLLTAFAAEGYRLLADALHDAAQASGGGFTDVGLAYVRFAIDHRAHFEVMFRPDLLRRDDPELVAAATRTSAQLRDGVASTRDEAGDGDGTGDVDLSGPAGMVAAWSLVHGFATLWVTGNVPASLGPPDQLARAVLDAVDWRG
jgi:AcrR family transcriptional regulator